MINTRASSLPLINLCAASIERLPGEVRIESSGEAADVGSAVHWLMQVCIGVQSPNDNLIDIAAQRFNVDYDELSPMFWRAWKAWRELAPFFPAPQTEREFLLDDPRGVKLTGHLDVSTVVGTEFRVADFKTGRLDSNHESQIRAYCWLGLQYHPKCITAYGAAIRTRDHVVDGYQWSRQELAEWWESLVAKLTMADKAYSPGPQCAFCPRGATCPAKTALVRQATEALVGESWILGDLPAEHAERGRIFGAILDQATIVEKICKQARDMIRADVIASGGRLPIDETRELVIIDQTRTEIAGTKAAIAKVEARVGDQLPECVSIGKTNLEKLVKASVGRGQKQAAWQETLDDLESIGALSKKKQQRLEVRRGAAVDPKLITEEVF